MRSAVWLGFPDFVENISKENENGTDLWPDAFCVGSAVSEPYLGLPVPLSVRLVGSSKRDRPLRITTTNHNRSTGVRQKRKAETELSLQS